MLFRNGWNAVQVQKFLGHHSPAFTLAVYVHLLPTTYRSRRFGIHLPTDAETPEAAVPEEQAV